MTNFDNTQFNNGQSPVNSGQTLTQPKPESSNKVLGILAGISVTLTLLALIAKLVFPGETITVAEPDITIPTADRLPSETDLLPNPDSSPAPTTGLTDELQSAPVPADLPGMLPASVKLLPDACYVDELTKQQFDATGTFTTCSLDSFSSEVNTIDYGVFSVVYAEGSDAVNQLRDPSTDWITPVELPVQPADGHDLKAYEAAVFSYIVDFRGSDKAVIYEMIGDTTMMKDFLIAAGLAK